MQHRHGLHLPDVMVGAGMRLPKQHTALPARELAQEVLPSIASPEAPRSSCVGGTGCIRLSARWTTAQADDQKKPPGSKALRGRRRILATQDEFRRSRLLGRALTHLTLISSSSWLLRAAIHDAACAGFLTK